MDLIEYLDRPGASRETLANSLGVTKGMVGHWCTGRHKITPERAKQIEAATGGLVCKHELRPDIFDTHERLIQCAQVS